MKRQRSSRLSERKETGQRSGLRSCSCEGSNENCRWCGGTGNLPTHRDPAPSQLPHNAPSEKSASKQNALANIEICDKCSFRANAAELRAHQLAHHSSSEIDCPKCDFHGTATELPDHLVVYHRPSPERLSKPEFQVYVCDTCGFRGPEFHVQEHVKGHIVRYPLGCGPPKPKRNPKRKGGSDRGYHKLTAADR
jgi:hypothetical protein